MSTLVTGAAGLIGSHLCELLLSEGEDTAGMDNLSFGNHDTVIDIEQIEGPADWDFRRGDVNNINRVWRKAETFSNIVHLASYKKVWDGSIKSSEIMDINFNMTKAVVDRCLSDNSKLIFASTSDIYGNSKTFSEDEPITMGPPTNIRYSYALSKWHSEQYILNCVKEQNLNAVIVRIFGCASPRSNRSWSGGHVPLFIDKAIKGETIEIHGDGLQTRSISHAKDIAAGIFDCMAAESGEIINFGTDQETTVRYVAEYIIKKLKSKSNIQFIPKEKIFGNYNEINRRFANTEKAKRLFNYQINYTTEQVIDEMVESYLK